MVKTTILVLTSLGVLGTGGQAVAPQAFEISAGAVTFEITADGFDTRPNSVPALGLTWITQGNKHITLRF